MLIWSIDETAGFDTAWVSVQGDRLTAEGRSVGQRPMPYWVDYRIETGARFLTHRALIECRWEGGSATVDVRKEDDGWSVDGERRQDLEGALDCDLAACPLTNTMPILRHELHRKPGDEDFVMAFIEIPSLRVVPSRQRYTHIATDAEGGGVVRYLSGSFQSDLRIDSAGFVIEYPRLGRRVLPPSSSAPDGRIDSRPGPDAP
jgi:uncharacterized protein